MLEAHEEAGNFLQKPLLGDPTHDPAETDGDDPAGGDLPDCGHIPLELLEPRDVPGRLGKIGPYEVIECVEAMAACSNLLVLNLSFAKDPEAAITNARRSGLNVVLAIEGNYRETAQTRAIPMASANSDIVKAIYFISAYANGLSPGDVRSLGGRMKQLSPQTELWIGFPAVGNTPFGEDRADLLSEKWSLTTSDRL